MRRHIAIVLLVWALVAPAEAFAFKWSDLFGGDAKGAYGFQWTDETGGNHSLAEYRGRPLILHLWASWCQPCQEEMASMSAWVKEHPAVLFLPVSLDRDIRNAADFLNAKGIDFPALLSDEVQARRIGAISLPTTMVIDAEGMVKLNLRGSRDWASGMLTDRLFEALGQQHAPASGGKIDKAGQLAGVSMVSGEHAAHPKGD